MLDFTTTQFILIRYIPIGEQYVSQNTDDLKYLFYIVSFCLLGAPAKFRFSG